MASDMKEVTDPAILAQLNSDSVPPLKEVTDPNVLSQLNGSTSQNSSPWNMPSLNDISNSPLVQGILGAGDAVRNTLASGLNLFPHINIPMAQSGQGAAYDVGNIAGNLGTFLGGGEVLDTARAASESLPFIGKLAQTLGESGYAPTVARQAIGGGIYGGMTSPNDSIDNAVKGTLFGAIAGSLPFAVGQVAKSLQYLQPQKYTQQIVDNLSNGQNLGDATKSVLGSVKDAYKQQVENASELYNGVRNSVPSGSIYAQIGKDNSQYLNLPSDVTEDYTKDIQKLHDKFISNPTFDNAHNLQSQLASRYRQLENSPGAPDRATANEMSSLQQARSALIQKNDDGTISGDIGNFLNNKSPDLANSYKAASDNFLENVAPYRSNNTLYSIASGDKTNISPSALSNIFKAPDADMQKVINDLPPDTMDKVLFTKLGKDTPANNPFAFLRAYGRLNEQGLGDYISPELQQQIDSLQNRIKWRSLAQSATGALMAGAKGAAHGSGGAAGMALAGGAVASPLMNYLGRRLPLDQIGNAVSSASQASYPYISKGILANLLNSTGGQQ